MLLSTFTSNIIESSPMVDFKNVLNALASDLKAEPTTVSWTVEILPLSYCICVKVLCVTVLLYSDVQREDLMRTELLSVVEILPKIK